MLPGRIDETTAAKTDQPATGGPRADSGGALATSGGGDTIGRRGKRTYGAAGRIGAAVGGSAAEPSCLVVQIGQ